MGTITAYRKFLLNSLHRNIIPYIQHKTQIFDFPLTYDIQIIDSNFHVTFHNVLSLTTIQVTATELRNLM